MYLLTRLAALALLFSSLAAPTCGSGNGENEGWGTVPAQQVTVGLFHACATLETGGVKCWGINNGGELGDGTLTERHVPVDVLDPDDPKGLLTGVTEVAAGSNCTCAVLNDGHVKCWGSNHDYVLGAGADVEASLTPVPVKDPAAADGLLANIEHIAAGEMHTCALTTAGGVKCWGRNGQGQLGTGDLVDRDLPVDVTGLTKGVRGLVAGPYDTCAVLADHTVQCWGAHVRWELGKPAPAASDTPLLVYSALAGGVAVGAEHICFWGQLGAMGGCVGTNGLGQLGNGTYDDSQALVTVKAADGSAPLGDVTRVVAGSDFTCALAASGAVQCWGDDAAGQLGDGTPANAHNLPVTVTGLAAADILDIAAGGTSTCAVVSGGEVQCWGGNSAGQLGDGSTTNRSTPTTVSGIGPAQ